MTSYFIGAPDTIRTYDLLLRKQTLYPAELRVHNVLAIVYLMTRFAFSVACIAGWSVCNFLLKALQLSYGCIYYRLTI